MASFLAHDSLLLHTAIAHARRIVSGYLDPEGLSGDRCLDDLLTLVFHPALDDAVAAAPAAPVTPTEIMQRAVADSRAILLRHFGPTAEMSGPACLDEMIGLLDAPELVEAGTFEPMMTARLVRRSPERNHSPRVLH